MLESSPDLSRRIAAVRVLLFDVDGVLTDGRLTLSSSGEESKRFHIKDGLGIVLAQQAGLQVALMSGRVSAAVDRRAKELGIPEDRVLSGLRDKQKAVRKFKEERGMPTEALAFIGDDLNDLLAFEEVGLAVAVADAVPELKVRAHITTETPGGEGAAREIIERILREQGRWEAAVAAYLDFLRRDPSASASSSTQ